MHIDSRHKQLTLLQQSLNWMCCLFWKVDDTLKGLLLCLITNYRLIFLWKAQMAVIIAPPPYFNTVNPFSNLKNHIYKNIKTTTYDMLWNCMLDRKLLTNSKWRPHFKMMMFFNCCVWMLKGYCLAVIMDLLGKSTIHSYMF